MLAQLLIVLFSNVNGAAPCDDTFRIARAHCPNTHCFIREIRDEECRKELCNYIKTIEGRQFCMYISKDFSEHLEWLADNLDLKKEQKNYTDWNRILMECNPTKLKQCQPNFVLAMGICGQNPTQECMQEHLGAECDRCLCYFINCQDMGWFKDKGIREAAEKLLDKNNINLTEYQEALVKKYQEEKKYLIPVFSTGWSNNIRTNIVRGYEKVSEMGLDAYCDSKIKRAWMTCGNGRGAEVTQGYTNCLKSLLQNTYCEEAMCRDGYWEC